MIQILLYEILIIILSMHYLQAILLYPTASVLQITASLAAPIELPGRKLYWNWGFQMNYELPSNLKQFYSAPIWTANYGERKCREVKSQRENITRVWYELEEKYHTHTPFVEGGKHPSDFTAGELYHSFENLLVSYGFHETCLLRSVCELAHHPFSDDQQNILTEILTFLLTPSIHQAFSPAETIMRQVYEEAERRGILRYNCAELYYDCKRDLLTSITNVTTNTKCDN